MGSNWPIHELSEFINIKHGFAFKGENFKDEQTFDVLITPGNFSIGGGFKEDKLKYYDGPVPEDYILCEGDLVVTMTDLSKQADTLGYSALIPSLDGHRILHNQRVGLVELKSDELDPTFLYYLLQSREYRHHVVSGATGTTVKHTSPTKIVSFSFRKPPKNTQILIGKHLMAIEAKEKLNASFNQTLEQMAQALFKSWFVDFDPVFDNLLASVDFKLENLETSLPDELKHKVQRRLAALNSLENAAECKASLIALAQELQAQRPKKEATQSAVQAAETTVKANFNANPNILAQHANTHAHFPNEFEHNEQLGWIPKGWDVGVSGDLVDVRDGTHDSPKKSEKGFPLVTSRHITSGRLDLSAAYLISELDYKKVNERSNVEYGDILLTMIGTVGVPYLVMDEPANYAIKNIGLFRTSKNLYLKNYLHILLKTDHMQAYLNARVAGTTQKYLSLKVLRNIDFLLPSNIVLEKFNSIVNNMLFKEKSNIDQINQLTKLRDTLLPKLISGELQIPDVATDEKIVD